MKSYRLAGRFHSVDWAAFLQHPEKQGLYPSPLIHDVPIQPGSPLVVIAWHDRLSAPEVIGVAQESAIPVDWQMTR